MDKKNSIQKFREEIKSIITDFKNGIFVTYTKRIIIRFIRLFGYDLKGIKKKITHNDFDSIIKFLLKDKKEHVYFDVGANIGDSIERFKKINTNALIHSFEPTPDLSKKLKDKHSLDKSIIINNCGITDLKGKLKFYSYKYHRVNSFVKIDENSKFLKSRLLNVKSNREDFEKIIDVDTTTIDIYCEENNINEIDFIKIDTQGSEEQSLKGMQNILSKGKVSIIELELILGFAYEKIFSFYDYEKYLNKHNYKLIALDNPGNIISYSNYQTNLLYVKNEIFENIRELHNANKNIAGVTKKADRSNPFSY